MIPLINSLLAALVVSVISFVGAISLFFSAKKLNKILLLIISFSAGSFMGGAFFHLLPEAIVENQNVLLVSAYLLFGFCLFFLVERVLRWRHCHESDCEVHRPLGEINLFGDGIHNFIDGMVIASAFAASPGLGLAVTVSIILHEIPQEIGDFGVLIYAGYTKTMALFFNFLSALVAIAGVIWGYILIGKISGSSGFLLAFAAGGFIYIAASDLIPEIHEEKSFWRSLLAFLFFILALVLMLVLKLIAVE